eukprot:GFUD01012130.1.p1 GENE.GFUD01012130.1~~GFUD01012130.1.p1  ORF type:complete len:449 (+),score=148.60 GFUD01012130.1:65-1411(+)
MKIMQVPQINNIEITKDPKGSLEKTKLEVTQDFSNNSLKKLNEKQMKEVTIVQNIDTPCPELKLPQDTKNGNAVTVYAAIGSISDHVNGRDIKEASRIMTEENSNKGVKNILKTNDKQENEESEAVISTMEETKLSNEIKDDCKCDSNEVTKIMTEKKSTNNENVEIQNHDQDDEKGFDIMKGGKDCIIKKRELSVDITYCPKYDNEVVTKNITDLVIGTLAKHSENPENIHKIPDSKVNNDTITVCEDTKTLVDISSDNIHSDSDENKDSGNNWENSVLDAMKIKTDPKCDYSKDKKVHIPPNQKQEESINDTVLENPDDVEDKETQNCVDDIIQNSDLPEFIEDPEFINRIKVFNNYRNFGAMYSAKKNFRKAEWAFKNGIKQTAGQPARSKDQLRSILTAEIEFRLNRARSLAAMGMEGDAREECQAVLMIDSNNTVAAEMIRSH